MSMRVRVGLGQDSHRFVAEGDKPLVLGGVLIPDCPGLAGNSDADVILHAICNAISSVTGQVVLGPVTDKLCKQGITDSAAYVEHSLKTLGDLKLSHVAVSLECRRPKMLAHIDPMRASIAKILGLTVADVGITATSGEGLTAFGRGEGIQALVIVTAVSS